MTRISIFLAYVPLVFTATIPPISSDLGHRAVAELDEAAFEEAQTPDTTATKAFAGTQIKTSDGRCLFVDELSGDFRANLTPIQVAECDATDGQGWDIITSGKHNNVADSVLVVSTLTNACFNFDPRRAVGNQVILFSCGGRADGGGAVTDSQLFPFTGGAGPISFTPRNDVTSCFTVKDDVVDIAACDAGDSAQVFTLTGAETTGGDSSSSALASQPVSTSAESSSVQAPVATVSTASVTDVTPVETVTATALPDDIVGAIPDPTDAVPVSRAGGTLQPTAAAESHERDDTATRAFTSVSIQTADGQCLFVDPTAGDFRQNLIPISLVECAGTPNEKFDIITAGKHNDAADSALVVSSLMNGCVSFDGRRPAGDTVTIFSCGGRAAGEGETNTGQLTPFTGGTSLVLAPESERNATCIVPGDGRLDSAPCTNDVSQAFTILT
ncbi:hypothetical protein F4778DRAFT_182357 [Xylariomycetidae sp. FL2044]|nr:hypothetical protein F4778DRAFT_182357 [Xylariomycetidae sp. FL2044]